MHLYLSQFSDQIKVFVEINIDDKNRKENIAADRQSPSAAGTELVGFVLGAEGRRSMKTENVATQHPGAPSFVRRPVLPDRVSPARRSSGLVRNEERERKTKGGKGGFTYTYLHLCVIEQH